MKKFVLLFVFVYSAVIFINDGFMASDEYWIAMTRYLPAQKAQLNQLVDKTDVNSAMQILPMHSMAQLALSLGIEKAYSQYRFVIASLALINVAILFFAFSLLGQLLPRYKEWFFLVAALYFAAPFSLTRPMFESLATPWLFLSLVMAMRYDLQPQNRKHIIWASALVCVAFLLRPQVGLCALALLIPPIRHKRWNDLAWVIGVGLIGFLLIGLPEIYFQGKYHYSFLAITFYNFQHGHEYGNEPWTFYPLILIALTALPFYIYLYPDAFLKNYFKEQQLNFAFVFLFVLLHSLFPQKFERFLIPIIPCLILALTPLVHHLYHERKKRRLRWASLVIINMILFFPASFSPAQKNIIDLARDVNLTGPIEKIFSVDEAITWIPDLFTEGRPAAITQISGAQLSKLDSKNCKHWVVLNAGAVSTHEKELSQFRHLKTYDVNYLEKIAYLLNKQNNLRRSALEIYTCPEALGKPVQRPPSQ